MPPSFRMPGDLPLPAGAGEAAPPPDAPLLVQLALSRAADLARAGRLEEAVGLLAQLRVASKQAPAAFHLCARIRAQAGQYEEAAELWKRVLQIDPAHDGARAGLREIQRLRARPLWLSTLLSWPVALALLALALLLALGRSAPAPAGEKLDILISEQKRLAEEVGRLRDALQARASEAAPDVDLAGLPVTAEAKGAETLLRFEAPLFEAGADALGEDAAGLLGRLAAVLAGKADVTVLAYGVEPVQDPRGLARRRAEAVAARLRAAGLRAEAEERPGAEAPGGGEAVALRLARVKR